MNQSARESEHYSPIANHCSVIQSSALHRCMQRAIFASKAQNEILRCMKCRPYRQRSVHQSARADERARMRSVHQSARADERRARTNVSPDERGGGNAASSEVARRIRAPAVITLVELATGLAVCSPGGRSASSPEARPRVGRRLVVGQDPPIALGAGAVRPQYRQLSDASRASPRASPGVIR